MASTTRKKIDARVKTLLENGVKVRLPALLRPSCAVSHTRGRSQTGHRSFFVIVGDRAREQIVNLHFLLSKAAVKTRPTVLWCYKEELDFSVSKKKRLKKIQVRVYPNGETPLGLTTLVRRSKPSVGCWTPTRTTPSTCSSAPRRSATASVRSCVSPALPLTRALDCRS